jgi:hypothetical protein
VAELSVEQKRALALAAARKRQAEASAATNAAPAAEQRIPIISDFNDFSNAFRTGATEGMTLGFADELGAGAAAPVRAVGDLFTGRGFDLGRAYDEGLSETRGIMADAKAVNPAAAVAGDVTGSLVTGGGLAKGGVTLMNGAKSLPGLIGRGAAEGSIYGGVSGFGRSEGDLEDRSRDAAWGAGIGGLAGGGISGVAGALASRAAKAAVPTVDDLKGQARSLYDQADASGVTFSRAEVKSVADDIAAVAIDAGIDPTLHPLATAALKRLQEAAATGMTVKNAQTMRRILAAAGKDPLNADQSRVAGMMLDKFDNMVGAKSPELGQARAIYHQAKKGELIETAIELAKSKAGQYGNGGMENALRTEFRALQRRLIKGQLKGLSPDEVAAINKVADGGPLENIARYIGKAAPTGIVSAGLGTGVPFALGTALSGGNPAIGAAASGTVMGAGIAGRSAAEALTSRNAVAAALMARNGGLKPAADANSPSQQAVMRALIAAGANETGQVPMPRLKTPATVY